MHRNPYKPRPANARCERGCTVSAANHLKSLQIAPLIYLHKPRPANTRCERGGTASSTNHLKAHACSRKLPMRCPREWGILCQRCWKYPRSAGRVCQYSRFLFMYGEKGNRQLTVSANIREKEFAEGDSTWAPRGDGMTDDETLARGDGTDDREDHRKGVICETSVRTRFMNRIDR